MKIRVFKRVVDGVFEVRINTEDWSEQDKDLMVRYGEPEINLGGTFTYTPPEAELSGESSSPGSISMVIDEVYARIMSETPFTHKFDSRDLCGLGNAKALASLWAIAIEERIAETLRDLRDKDLFFATEEITEY